MDNNFEWHIHVLWLALNNSIESGFDAVWVGAYANGFQVMCIKQAIKQSSKKTDFNGAHLGLPQLHVQQALVGYPL